MGVTQWMKVTLIQVSFPSRESKQLDWNRLPTGFSVSGSPGWMEIPHMGWDKLVQSVHLRTNFQGGINIRCCEDGGPIFCERADWSLCQLADVNSYVLRHWGSSLTIASEIQAMRRKWSEEPMGQKNQRDLLTDLKGFCWFCVNPVHSTIRLS